MDNYKRQALFGFLYAWSPRWAPWRQWTKRRMYEAIYNVYT